ncbi:MAG: tail fiber domain-containing protein, partial [Candidatus Korobacteraceae bacterium]
GNVSSSTGSTVGVKGNSTSTAGTGVRGTNTATSGFTTGVSGYVASAAGIAGAFNNAAGGKILSGQNNGVENFYVDGLGNVNSVAGTYQIAGSGVVSIGTLTDDNLFLGVGAGVHNISGTGQYKTFSGQDAGYGNTTGTGNTFFGLQAGYSNTTGGGNVFSGFQAGKNNTTACCNTFSGTEAGYTNSTGSYNTFYGQQAGYSNTSGTGNVFSGLQAGFSNTTGGGNVFAGNQAGLSNTTACCNTFLGTEAGYTNSTGGSNTFSGQQAGYNTTTGGANTFYGLQAGYSNTTGKNNTFAGYQAGYNNTTGKSNLYLANQGPTSGSESNTIRIGTQGTDLGEQNVAYIAGIYGSTTTSGSAVFVDSTGKLGTGGGGGLVTSFNGRAGAVVPAANDYSFSLLSGTLGNSQLSGTYTNALTLSNTSNSFMGNGAGLGNVNAAQLGGLAASAFAQLSVSDTFQGNVNMEGDTRVDFSGLNSGSYTPAIRFGTGNSGEAIASDRVGSVNKDGIDLYTSHMPRLSITNGGSVGIGTATPQATLDVNGGINSSTTYQIGGNTVVSIGSIADENLFLGKEAGVHNVTGTGTSNAFSGANAGYQNTTGFDNTFSGALAGYSNTTGAANAFFGAFAGNINTTGYNNTFLGTDAGFNNVTGNSDIYIANAGPSSGTESNTIRIGAQGSGASQQDVTFIAGIYGATSSGGVSVYINSSGRLGTQTSSLRFKEQVRDLGDTTDALMKLRPVSFLYKPQYANGDRTLQYGLIAEEVAQVYPELVAYDNDGQPSTVRYQYLTPMLLNELQKEHAIVTAQQRELQTQLQQIKTQRQEIDGLKLQLLQQNASLQERLSKLESYVATQTRMQTASDVQPAATASPNGDSQ